MSAEPVKLKVQDTGPRSAVGLVRAYLTKPDPRVRANAVAALHAIGGDDAVEALIDLAVKEGDREVRGDAEAALLALDATGLVRRRLIARLAANPHLTDLVPLMVRLRSKGARWNDREIITVLVTAAQEGEMAVQAEQLLAEEHGENAERVVEELASRLDADKAAIRESAYALLGRLRRRSAEAADPGKYRRPRLKRIGDLFRRETWRRGIRWGRMVGSVAMGQAAIASRPISWTLVWCAIGGTTFGAILVAIYLAATLTPEAPFEFYPILMLMTPVLGFLLSVLATRWATPAYLQFDRATSALIDAVAAGLWVVLPVLFALGALLFLMGLKEGIASWTLLLISGTIVTSLFVAAIRLGSAVGFGGLVSAGAAPAPRVGRYAFRPFQPEHGRPRRRVLNAMGQWMAGTAAGLIVLAVVLFVGRRLFPADAHRSLSLLLEGLWVFLLPTAPGIAAAFAALDWPAATNDKELDQARGNRARWLQRAACWTLVLVFGGVLVAGTVRAAGSSRPTDIARSGEVNQRDRVVGVFPMTIHFRTAFPQRVVIELPDGEGPDRARFGLDLHQRRAVGRTLEGQPICDEQSDKLLIGYADFPQKLEQFLGWGCYSVDVIEINGETAAGARDSVIQALEARASRGGRVAVSAGTAAIQLRTVLNSERDREGAVNPERVTVPGSTVWQIDKLKAVNAFELQQPATLFARVGPPADSRGPGRIAASSASTTGTGVASPEEDKPEFTLSLWSVTNGEVQIAETTAPTRQRVSQNPDPFIPYLVAGLMPGKYELRLQRADSKPLRDRFVTVDLMLDHVAPRDPESTVPAFGTQRPTAASGQPLNGYWRVTALPQRFTFAVKFPQTVFANTDGGGMPGFRGFLQGRPGMSLGLRLYATGSSKPMAESLGILPPLPPLEPGTYELEVYGEDDTSKKLFPILLLSPPPAVFLSLNAERAGVRMIDARK